jgi:anti-sigma B factor antagonist
LAENEQVRQEADQPPDELTRLRTTWAEGRAERQREHVRAHAHGGQRPADATALWQTHRLDDRSRLVRPSGAIDAFSSPALSAMLDAALAEGARRVVLDLSQVTLIDSSGLGAVLHAFLRLRSDGGALELISGAPSVMRGFELTGLDKILRLVEPGD